MWVNRFALIAASLGCVSVCWATYPNLEAMLNNTPANTVIAPNGVPLVTAINALPPELRATAYQSLSPLADGSLTVASDGSMRQFVEAIDERLRPVPKLCKDIQGFSGGDTPGGELVPATREPVRKLRSGPAVITADPPQSPLHTQIEKLDPNVQKIVVDSWASQNAEVRDTESAKQLETAKKEADIAKKEAEIAKKEADLAKKEADAAKLTASSATTGDTATTTDATAKATESSEKKVDDLGLSGDTQTSSPQKKIEEEPYRCKGVWAQLLGSSVDQKTHYDVLGYDAHVWGFTVGRDGELSEAARVGFAGGYQQARAYSDVYSGSFFDVKRYQLSMYGRYDYWGCFYTQWALTGAFNRYDNKHKLLVAPSVSSSTISNMAHGIFTAWEYDVYFEKGLMWGYCNYLINPKIFMTYAHFNPEGYFEKDAFDLNLSVKYQDMDILTFAAGVKLNYQAEFEKAFVVPEVHAYYFYDAIHDRQLALATYVPANNLFYTQGVQPEKSHYEIGGALALHSDKYVMLKFAYDFYWCSDYHRQQGYIQARYHWA